MKIHDISVPISDDLTVWPGDPGVSLLKTRSIAAGDPQNVTKIVMGAHTGTHIDAPSHYHCSGKAIDDLDLEACLGPCLVIETDAERLIEKIDLEGCDLETCARILFKTRNSRASAWQVTGFREDYVSLSAAAAAYIAGKKIMLVGIDYLSIEGFHSTGNEVHKILLEKDIVILEGLNLSSIKPGAYELICLPLKLKGADGSPVRAILRER